MDPFANKEPSREEVFLLKCATLFGIKKASWDKLRKSLENPDNESSLKLFFNQNDIQGFAFVLLTGAEAVQILTELPALSLFKRKSVLVVKARRGIAIDKANMHEQLIFMEFTRQLIEHLQVISEEAYMPILNNPLNQQGWSDLVSKDLLDKLHFFLSNVQVTIGQIRGRTMLPLPPTDITSSERTTSKDKAHILETAIITWTKQIKSVLKQDPEGALKAGNDPDPRTEIRFWKNKAENLNQIHNQLQSERVKKVLKFLDQNKSAYTPPFSKLQKEVQAARMEANDNVRFLQQLEDLFEDLTNESKEFTELPDLFQPIMHVILLVWTHSRNYNTPSRLVVLIREICNAIITQSCRFINKETIFNLISQDTPGEALQKLGIAFDVSAKFKEAYFEYKAKSNNTWKIMTNALFIRLDAFMERCQDIMHFTETIVQFNRLNKIDIGSTKGSELTTTIGVIFKEFSDTVDNFKEVKYDIMNIACREFDDDFYGFRQRIKELERRLAAVLTQAFDDCDTIEGKFKLLDSFEGLLNRPIIQDELEKKQITLLELYKVDLKKVQKIFMDGKALVDNQDEKSPVYKNLPPISGALNWTRGLYERVNLPMERLLLLGPSIQEREQFKDVQKLHASILKSLREYELEKTKSWAEEVEANSDAKLAMFLLNRGDDKLLEVNFDPALVRTLREVKYLLLLTLQIPNTARRIYDKVEVYRSQTGNLDLIVGMYNSILKTLHPVEFPLLQDRIDRINQNVEPGISKLCWKDDGIEPFIKGSMIVVKDVDTLVKKMKLNVRKMQDHMTKWAEKPLIERKNKPLPPEDFEQQHKSIVLSRHQEIKDNGRDITRLLKDSQEHIRPPKGSPEWKAYQDYVNSLIIEGIATAIISSLSHLSFLIDPHAAKKADAPIMAPLFDVKVSLQSAEVVFDPPIGSTERSNGVRDIINSIIGDFFFICTLVNRLDTSPGDFLVEIKDHFDVLAKLDEINGHLEWMDEATQQFISQYMKYSFLWKEDLNETFQKFLEYEPEGGEKKEGEEEEQESEETHEYMQAKILKGVVTKRPQLEYFNEKITELKSIQTKIHEFKTPTDIAWLRINSLPLKNALSRLVEQWIDKWTLFLLNNLTLELSNILKFIDEVDHGIKELPESADNEKDKSLLMKVMTHLRDMKAIKEPTLAEVDPMKEAVNLLKKHGVHMDEDLIVKIENSKTALEDTGERALEAKEKILPLQAQETKNIKQDLMKFKWKVEEFREEFQKNCPFHITDSSPETLDKAYNTIEVYYEKLVTIEEEAREYRNLETLFELQPSDYKQLKDCRNELKNLKNMWDLISLIEHLFKSWKMTLWDKIDTEYLLVQIKDIQQKQTHPNQNKEIKHWKGFLALQERVKNMNTILPLISDLHSKYMEKRHWRQLMTITGKDIAYDSQNFCLDDLIQLQLYRYAQDVSEIVEMAQKESKIENNLIKIENNWENENIEFVEYKDTKLLGNLDDMIEVLEQNSMDLMSMLAQRHVEFFKERVLKWQRILRTVDSVIEIWLKVQKNWKRLETIFLASQDIRAQLPEDTKRFEGLDIEFKDVMRDASESPSVVEACLAEGREELLQQLFQGIDMCERSLNDYLEQKKKAFPRFYFVSNQALLDILSNGNNPEKVGEYLGDCFDGMKSLDFVKKEGAPRPYKSAQGMFSKEGEYVKFSSIFTAQGAVENWLTDLERMMRLTLRDILEDAKGTADNWEIEKPREEWLNDYCAQLALLVTEIIWTEEVYRAFDELEGGGESAMKDYLKISIDRINALIRRVRGKLTKELRIKIITIITIDVHSRDVVNNFTLNKISDSSSFAWQKQLKFYWRPENEKNEESTKHAFIKIADWQTKYTYEYVGNCGRLVITPLTDRCYITLTQALNLTMGGAPAGPAGTGKTETVKDLGRALGLQVVVFNCSEQMSYQSMAQIFMGLSQTGNWGCFDEFNRIRIEVLSVVSTQVSTCLDALKQLKLNATKTKFLFLDDEINIVQTSGFFITMNPGYAGRTELPENLKALFRSCAMVVPDIVLICENMLMSEGFQAARELSRKFMTLYELSKELLSKQKHYDWGLRAVKSVLRQAGMLRRADPDIEEYPLLMRALRDFNLPKIVSEDRQIFLDLIRDLFPKMECESKQDPNLRGALEKMIRQEKLQAEEGFILKCIQLSEILEVRHSMFMIGKAGTGKTTIWKVLAQTMSAMGYETQTEPINPKAVTSNELFGCLTKTKEWKDGVLSTVMRNMSKNEGPYRASAVNKWIVLDGDVDPDWIESLNTVMDDNKVLTLVSNERIPLSNAMRLILEVSNLREATPATVSRGGVLFVNDGDVGWKPFTDSWLEKFKQNDEHARSVFYLAFTQYLSETNLDEIHSKESICPMVDMAYIHSLCMIIDALYDDLYSKKETHEFMKSLKSEGKDDDIKIIYEAFFIFAMMWAVGGPLSEDKFSFSSFMKSIAKVKFPDQGQIYDYFFDPLTMNWVDWNATVKTYEPQTDTLFQNIVVPTADTTKQRFLLELHVKFRKPVLYVGAAGTGKTTIIKDFFSSLDPETLLSATINFNSYTDSKALQSFMDGNLDKRQGKTYGPPPNKQIIFFMDDLNMPEVDKYGTQTPICLIRQLLDYWTQFNRDHLEEKERIVDCQFMACMNPKAGSFNIDTRLQRHYSVMSCLTAERTILDQIYRQILEGHLRTFDPTISGLAPKFIVATIDIFRSITDNPQFMPSARKFHYQFNMRDVSKIIQGLMGAKGNLYRGQPIKMYRLWAHEAERVFKDRMCFQEDFDKFQEYVLASLKHFDANSDEVLERPNIYTSFLSECQGNEKAYLPTKDITVLKNVLTDKLEEYNESNAEMNLVLFEQAIEHITRIARIVDLPAGNALLVGVGGSGKQSLSRLASFLLQYDVFTIVVSTNYGIGDLKTDLQTLYTKAGCQGQQMLFMLTDSQIQDEKFLVYINDMLSAGFISDLFAKDEMDTNLGKIRNEAKSAGIADAPDQLLEFFIDKSRKNIHVALCFSPVGQAFRVRARKFPGLINCTSIDWFHTWPRDALISVAARFLSEIELPSDEVLEQISIHMAGVHLSIGEANKKYLSLERRYNYTTPKSYLELIEFYKKLLGIKRSKVNDNIQRLETGLLTLKDTKEQVEGLQQELRVKQVEVDKQRDETNALIEVVKKNNAIAEEEQAIALKEEEKTEELAFEANKLKENADKELEEAIPMMERAKEAVNCLNKASIVELKNFPKPPPECVEVTKAVLILRGEKRSHGWQNAQRMMGNPMRFIEELGAYNAEDIDQPILDLVKPVISQDFFKFDIMWSKSQAAAYLCNWVVNLVSYNQIYKKVKPLMDESKRASDEVEKARIALGEVKARVAAVNEKVEGLRKKLEEAEATKERVEKEAETLQTKLELAQRLVNGLADENVRWGNNVKNLKTQELTMVGDALLSSAFVSYIGAFSSRFRKQLWAENWILDIFERKIPATEGVDPLDVLATNADMAGWKNDGLPEDRVSLENASIITNCSRWPLIIDPQQQGSKWIRGKEGDQLISIQLSQKNWIKKVEQAITNGQVLFIESVGQEIDAVLDPVLSRAIVKKSRTLQVIRLGQEDIEYNKNFKLYLQTKLFNPHYRPETAAQCTLINFIVTEGGLEEQLLALVVNVEKPELESTKQELVRKQNEFQVILAKLEDDLLNNLSDADPATILTNIDLIEGLENTKKTAIQIGIQAGEAKETEIKINQLREVYRIVAIEGSMLYFLLIQLCNVDHMYQYSLESFTTFFFKAIDKTEQFEDEEPRVKALQEMIRETIYQWVSRGLFVRHKQIFLTLITFRLMQKGALPKLEYDPKQVEFLVKCPLNQNVPNPLKEWLPDVAWFSVQKLIELEGFENFSANLERDAPQRFKDWYSELTPETMKLPLDWKKLESMPFQKLLVIRCLRPDRITSAMDNFIREMLPNGEKYVDMDSTSSFAQILYSSLQDSSPSTPIFFILSPGADPVKDVEILGRKNGFEANKNFWNVALGEGQDVVAMQKLQTAHKEGHWVMLQNIHLMPRWLLELEKKLDEFALEGSNPAFRLFLSAEPSSGIPIGILERSIKLTNEPPAGLKANMNRAFTFFLPDEFQERESKIKTILFALCYFHSVMIERRKFGAKGWNMHYAFNMGDLRDSALVLNNYMETAAGAGKIPWDDLRYIFGEIMYGGHIVDDWDRILCNAYLTNIMNDQLLDEAELFPFAEGKGISFRCPPVLPYSKYLEHIETLPGETPLAFGMHPNAEIGFRTDQCIKLFMTLQDLQPRDDSLEGVEGGGKTEKVQEFMTKTYEDYQLDQNRLPIDDIVGKIPDEERGPFQNVFLQECEYMNQLIAVILDSLQLLTLAFKGELTMTESMEKLIDSIFLNRVPATWAKLAFPSIRPLGSWMDNLSHRLLQLNQWKEEPTQIPRITFLNRLFNPQSFLTAIKQLNSQRTGTELNKLYIQTDITKRMFTEITEPPREGAYCFGFHVEGARWDIASGQMEESIPRKPFSVVPVVCCKAAPVLPDGKEEKGVYQCPVYKTETRGATYVFTAQLKTKYPPQKWILAGVSCILDVEGIGDYLPGKE